MKTNSDFIGRFRAIAGFLMAAALVATMRVPVVVAQSARPASPSDAFEERLIRGGYGYAYGIAAADLDGDGDLDLTSSDTVADKLLWFENDGRGGFSERLIQEDDPGWFERHAIGDVDGDGRLDVVVVKNRDGDLLWFRNNGSLLDGQLWKRHVITRGGLPGAYDVTLADFDGDGDLDAAASSWKRGKRFSWFANPGAGKLTVAWQEHIIEAGLLETRTVEAADLNGDGKPDLLASDTVGGQLVWYENSGEAGRSWRKHVIDNITKGPTHGHWIDLDADGDLDVVVACGMRLDVAPAVAHHAAWYENVGRPGQEIKWQRHKIGDVVGAFEAVGGDLDGDGDHDVVVTGWDPGQIVWFENTGAARRWTLHSLKQKWVRANSVILADLTGDGRLDIAATAERGANEFRYWRNTGKHRPSAAPKPGSTTDYQVTPPPEELGLPKFYAKYTHAHGYPIVSSGSVNDYALKEAAYLVDMMLAERPDIRQAMIASGSRLIVMAHNEFTTDIPEYAMMRPKDFWDARARGLGGSREEPTCSCAEENVLAYKGDPYAKENILIHEFAHNIHLRGLVNLDPTFDKRLEKAFDHAMAAGLWKGKYASTNHAEYFAEGVQSWFNNNRPPDHDHNHVDTRQELLAYDPGLAAICEEVFGKTTLVYTKPTTRLKGHLAGYQPADSPPFQWPKRLDAARKRIHDEANKRGQDRKKEYKN